MGYVKEKPINYKWYIKLKTRKECYGMLLRDIEEIENQLKALKQLVSDIQEMGDIHLDFKSCRSILFLKILCIDPLTKNKKTSQ